ncbi:hypothetical protein VRRI112168_09030 [Vreelandella rituensis]|uniref:Uncharacterized protein n=1 Tax=Vreelandella rituensis TaxID=2282306 RepID=A0A368U4M2_9GAMM|nr:hypothetical protein [Halomonas rituensis]RCV92048.1 hypothetical protein DU506_09800 [Halomonas rituensis]
MSDKDQAAGLRKWANLQRQQKEGNEEADSDAPALPDDDIETVAAQSSPEESTSEELPSSLAEVEAEEIEPESASVADDDDLFDFDGAFAAPEETASATASVASEPEVPPAPPKVRIPLVVVGLPGTTAAQAHKVKERLRHWAALGREWAGDPEQWDIHVVAADAAEVATLARQYRRWALWVESDAEAFVQAFRTLRLLHDAGGPRRLLALHEPGLSRRGLLDNLHEAAQYYLGTELLILAR